MNKLSKFFTSASFCFLLTFVLMTSCAKEPVRPFETGADIEQLIAGDSLKVWKIHRRYNGKTRMNMGDCFLSYRQTFWSDGRVTDNNEAYPDCGPSLEGQWCVVKDSLGYSYIRIESERIPSLFGIQDTYKDFRIFFANKDSLQLSFKHQQYGTMRRISDYLVEESLEVPDRDFHF